MFIDAYICSLTNLSAVLSNTNCSSIIVPIKGEATSDMKRPFLSVIFCLFHTLLSFILSKRVFFEENITYFTTELQVSLHGLHEFHFLFVFSVFSIGKGLQNME